MGPASPNGYPLSPNGHAHYLESTPASSTPTINDPFDRSGLGDFASSPSMLHPAAPLWPHRLSASFSAMADQIAAASQALALVPSTAFSGSDVSAEMMTLKSRLEGIERRQEQMMAEFEALKTQLATPGKGDGTETVAVEGDPGKLEELEKKLNELSEIVKIDQERLPARLQNSRATVMKAPLKTPVTTSGKPVPGFPGTRGEFEHITKERYEALLKAYGLVVKGDTEAKREAIRVFAGIPQDGQ